MGWNLFGDNDEFGRMGDDSGYQTAYFEVEAGVSTIPNFGFTTDPANGGDGSTIDFYEASNNGGELIFSMKVLSGLVPDFEVRFESSDGRVAVQGFSANLDGLVPNSDWQEFRFDLGNFFDIDNSNLVRISIAPDTPVDEMVQYQIAQLRFTYGDSGSIGGFSYIADFSPFATSGAIRDGDLYIYPTGAADWAGFANVNTEIYPLSFPNGGQIMFNAYIPEGGVPVDINFKFERLPYPEVEPSFYTQLLTISNTSQESFIIEFDSHGANIFESFLLYVKTVDAEVNINNIVVSAK